MTREERHAKDDIIVELRTGGKTFEEISQMTGRRVNFVREVCRDRLGITRVKSEWTDERKAKAYLDNQKLKRSETDISETCLKIGFEYVGGYTNSNGFVMLKCPNCGTELKRQWNAVRKMARGYQKTIICETCFEISKAEAERRKNLEKKAQEQKQEQERAQKFWNQKFKQESFSFCQKCGQLFITRKNTKFCSRECLTANNNSRHKDRRLKRIKNVRREGIDLKKLYLRDKGVCWLCRTSCDWNDYKITEKAFVAGENYPSIDHVVPLSKGGSHTWDNVRLAHRGCNRIKRDSLVADTPQG